jgi:hypothetical protein
MQLRRTESLQNVQLVRQAPIVLTDEQLQFVVPVAQSSGP